METLRPVLTVSSRERVDTLWKLLKEELQREGVWYWTKQLSTGEWGIYAVFAKQEGA